MSPVDGPRDNDVALGRDMVEHGLIPNQTCVDCGATALNTAPMVKNAKPPLSTEEYAEVRARCPKCRAKYLKNRKVPA